MPKLLQINVTANWGSTGRIAESIGIAALSHGWESIIAYGRCYNPSKSHLIRVGNGLNTYLHFAEQRIRDNEGRCSRIATKSLIKRIERIAPDVVQLHNIHDHYLNYQLLFDYLNQTDIKVVWTFHDCWSFTGHCFHFVTQECMRWQTGCFKCPMKHVLPKTVFDDSKKNYDLKKSLFVGCRNLTIVPCSEWMATFVRQSFLKDKRIEVIRNGVDLNVFKPTERSNGDEFEILAVSNVWNEEKGLKDIFKLREILDKDYRITIVGLTAKQKNDLPDGIVGIQRTQNIHELVCLYSKASVLINPTYADTFPSVNLESLACGTPVITYRTGGSPEAISPETGWVLDKGDVDGMASVIERMKRRTESEIVIQRLACRNRAEQLFDKNKCFEEYILLYESLLRKK